MSPSGYFPHDFATGASIGAGGTRSADIRGLRSAFGDLDYLQSPPNASPTYTPPVSSAIKWFQGDFGFRRVRNVAGQRRESHRASENRRRSWRSIQLTASGPPRSCGGDIYENVWPKGVGN